MDAGRAGTGLRQGPGAVPDRAPDRRRCRNRIGGWRDQAELAAPARRWNPRLTWADPPPAWSAGDRVCGLQRLAVPACLGQLGLMCWIGWTGIFRSVAGDPFVLRSTT